MLKCSIVMLMKMTSINVKRCGSRRALLSFFVVILSGMAAQAQTFVSSNNDLMLGFRKNAPYTENNEVVVNIGQASAYFNLAVGSTVPARGFTASQVTPGSFASLNNLSWSVFGAYVGSSYPGYVGNTLWLTVPRTNNAVRSTDALRLGYSVQQVTKSKILSISGGASGAAFISKDLGASNQFNTVSFVRESIAAYSAHIISVWMKGTVDPTQGTLNDTWPPSEPNAGNIEVTTPGTFTSSSVRSDLYEVRPLTTGPGVPVVDPHTGTSGLAWYIGYFELKPDGTMTFTRENAQTTTPPPPPSPMLSLTRSGTATTISFGTTNGATYTLYYTNGAGINARVAVWPSLPSTVTGDGSTKSFTDSSTDADRVYRVSAQ